ncbi:hypothetical protein ACLVWU_05980 [Bdellovibrio sp. HCB290]|uniref:hypothetical protein n=1 Tax=Bdellovibrio sp. HCB290 TaxID=3394356 RepID=UPI0039B4DB28
MQSIFGIFITVLLFTSVSMAGGDAGLLAICNNLGCTPQEKIQLLQQVSNQCEIEVKIYKCEELEKDATDEDRSKFRRCDPQKLCDQVADANTQIGACLRGYRNSLIALGEDIKILAAGMGKAIDQSWEQAKENKKQRLQFIAQCEKSLECKRDLIKNVPSYSAATDEELSKISAAALFVEYESKKAYLQSIQRSVPNTRPPEAHPADNELTAEQKAKLLNLAAVIKENLKKEYQKYNCYSQEAQSEMACYAVGQVVDPLFLATATFKGARAALALGKEVSNGSKIMLRVEQLEKSSALTRNEFIKKYVDYNPTTVAQNEKFIALAEKGKEANAYFVNIENSQMKYLNDTIKNKNLVTSMTNYHKDLVLQRFKDLQKEFPDLRITEYSDFKSLRFAFEGKVTPEIEKRIQEIFKSSNDEFVKFMRDNNLIRQTDTPEDYFRAGVGNTADEAGIAARYARKTQPGEVVSYKNTDLKVDLGGKIQSIERDRVALRQQLANTKMLDGHTFQSEVFDIVRKNQGDPKAINLALMKKYSTSNISDETLAGLQRYVKNSDEFSPGLMVAKRENANLNDAAEGGFTMDFVGLGASNMKGTAEALAKSKDLDGVLAEARLAEKQVTEAVNKQKSFFEKVVKESVEPGKLKSICSGDDCVAVATKPLSEQEKMKVLNRVADSKYASKMRFAFVNDGVKSAETRNMLSTHGESIEKLLRKNLAKQFKAYKLDGLTFGVDMRTDTLNEGTVKLLMGQSQDVYLTKSEQARIKEVFKKTVQEFNDTVYKKAASARYEASP